MCCCMRVIHMVAKFAEGAYQAVPMVARLMAVIFAMAARVRADRTAARLTPHPSRMAGSVREEQMVPLWVEHREADLLTAVYVVVLSQLVAEVWKS